MANRDYTTDSLIENYLNKEIPDVDLNPFILATQKYIEQYTHRVFKADSTASARSYDGNGRQALNIDDCVEVTLVEIGNNTWGDSYTTIPSSGANSYITLPTNNEADEVPINKIGLRANVWTHGVANNRITAKWGYSVEVPSDIQFAATVLASGMYNENKGGNTGAIKSEKIGQYSVTYADSKGADDLKRSMEILDSYRKMFI
jgi:hypothetical protein